jgi:hypothetical protein
MPRDAYYQPVETDRMDPMFRRGDSLMVAPHRRRLVVDRECLLQWDGVLRPVLVVGLTADHVTVQEYSRRRTVRLSRRRWRVAGQIFGVVRA